MPEVSTAISTRIVHECFAKQVARARCVRDCLSKFHERVFTLCLAGEVARKQNILLLAATFGTPFSSHGWSLLWYNGKGSSDFQ